MKPWRRIVGKKKAKDETVKLSTKSFYYHMVPVTTVTLECGHKKVYRGSCAHVPQEKARCSACPDA